MDHWRYNSKREMKKAFREGKGIYDDGQSSYSVNCQEARARGRRPMTEAVRMLRELAMKGGVKVQVKQARAALLESHDGEWHHVSKYGNRVNYYDVSAAMNRLGIELKL